jgi:lipid-A-disaccharide synthase
MTLMPGSRPHEIEKLLPVMLEVIREMKERYPDYQFVIPVAPNLPEKEVKRIRGWEDKQSQLLNLSSSQPLLLNGQSIKALLASDVAVIASGTATLQAAILGVPMVVVYKLSTLTYLIGRLIVKVKHISLVNILLDYLDSHSSVFSLQPSSLRIKELLQEDADRENIMNELTKIITDLKYRDEMASQLKKTADIFMDKKASLKMAGIVEKLGE